MVIHGNNPRPAIVPWAILTARLSTSRHNLIAQNAGNPIHRVLRRRKLTGKIAIGWGGLITG